MDKNEAAVGLKKDSPMGMVKKAWTNYSFIFVFAIILIAYAIVITSNGNAFNFSHISSILSSQNTVIVGTMAFGMALIIIITQIDLSIGSMLVLVTGITIITFNTTNNIFLTIIAALATGTLCGLINGLMVGYAGMPGFVATLGTQLIYRSITLTYVRVCDPEVAGSSSSMFALVSDNSKYEAFKNIFGTGKIYIGPVELPFVTILYFGILVVAIIVARKTKLGRYIYATGSNRKAAELVGINTKLITCICFTITGFLCGIASIIQAAKIGNVTPSSSGVSYEMYAIAACVLGGISMAGGKGKMVGVLFGALSYTIINFIIVSLKGVSIEMQDAFQGFVLIGVIIVQTGIPILREYISNKRKRAANAKAMAK